MRNSYCILQHVWVFHACCSFYHFLRNKDRVRILNLENELASYKQKVNDLIYEQMHMDDNNNLNLMMENKVKQMQSQICQIQQELNFLQNAQNSNVPHYFTTL